MASRKSARKRASLIAWQHAAAVRRTRPYSHAPIPAPMHAEGAAWSTLVREANAERERIAQDIPLDTLTQRADSYGIATAYPWRIPVCAACGYVTRDIPSSADDAHDELCCGLAVCDASESNPPFDVCVTHDVVPAFVLVVA